MKRILSSGWILFLICLTIGCQISSPIPNPLTKIKTPGFRQFEQELHQQAKIFSSFTEIQLLAAGYSPTLSPNGRYIAFSGQGTDGEYHIWLMDIEGTNLKQLTHFEGDYAPQWSPNSQQIIFYSYGSNNFFDPRNWGGVDTRKSAIWTVDIDGENLRQLTPNQSKGDRNPSWSPDGKCIVWIRNNRGDNLWIADSQGQNARPLTNEKNEFYAESKWSADSQTIYISSNEEPHSPSPCSTQTWTAIDINDQNNPHTVNHPVKPILREQTNHFNYCVDQGKLFKVDRQNNTHQAFEFPGLAIVGNSTITTDQKTLIFGLVMKGGGKASILLLKLNES